MKITITFYDSSWNAVPPGDPSVARVQVDIPGIPTEALGRAIGAGLLGGNFPSTLVTTLGSAIGKELKP